MGYRGLNRHGTHWTPSRKWNTFPDDGLMQIQCHRPFWLRWSEGDRPTTVEGILVLITP